MPAAVECLAGQYSWFLSSAQLYGTSHVAACRTVHRRRLLQWGREAAERKALIDNGVFVPRKRRGRVLAESIKSVHRRPADVRPVSSFWLTTVDLGLLFVRGSHEPGNDTG